MKALIERPPFPRINCHTKAVGCYTGSLDEKAERKSSCRAVQREVKPFPVRDTIGKNEII